MLDQELDMGHEPVSRGEINQQEATRYAELNEGESLDDYLSDLIRTHDLIARANGRLTVEEKYGDVNSPLGRDPARPAGR